jgi:hypothetical protein
MPKRRDEEPPEGCGAEEEGPSAEALRQSILERIGAIHDRHALLVIDAVVSLAEPPFDTAVSLEAVLGVAEMVAGAQALEEMRERRGRGDDSC